ncbi:bluetail domain-containing putative surface protein [Acidovorax sp. A1169]|uniref:bluetail domain-containing putative surface protein n=1 Tax=Acidovorax sp. A1169 TaxID=3059524 RepID=UPI0027377FCE|nr:bluetail domain-containing putative surface protein [Acidovorax sp. A1169]MDP4076491.1 bluetail domain-containing putative surface protein [Acidovorax sp. A1169]
MPATVFQPIQVTMLNRAFNDQSPAYSVFSNQVAQAVAVGFVEFARAFGALYVSLSEDQLSTKLLGNLGVLPNAVLQAALKNYLVEVGKENVGIVALQLGEILSTLENAAGDQAVYKAAAVAWNNEVETSFAYSTDPANTSSVPIGIGPIGPGGITLSLTSADDVLSPTAAEAKFKTTAYNDTILAITAGFLSATDLVDGGGGVDTLKATLAAGATVAPALQGIERVFITAGVGAGFNAGGNSSLQQVWVDSAVGAAEFTGVNMATTVGIQNSSAGGALTVGFTGATGAADTASLVFADATGADEVIVTSIENLNVNSTAGTVAATKANQVKITADLAETIVITGDQGLSTTVQGAHIASIDASALGKSLNLTMGASSAATVVVLGGVGADTFSIAESSGARLVLSAGGGEDTIHLNARAAHSVTTGAGADVVNVTFAAAQDKALDVSTAEGPAASAIVVSDFAVGVDVLAVKGTGLGKVALTGSQFAEVAASSSLLTAAQLAASSAAAKGSIVFRYGADTYVLVNDGTTANALDAADSLIKLTGVAVLADASWTAA